MKMRKLVVFLAAAMIVVMPFSAHALGFGNIKQLSALNEPLLAEIELLSPTEDDIANLKVRLASPDAFLRAGIDRSAQLSQMKFKVVDREDGSYFIKVTTRQPVREPFLNFLLEMDWENGRMLREYTMLLDPPGLVKKQPTVVETPPVAEPTPVAEAPIAAPEAAAETPFVPIPAAEEAPMAAEVETPTPAAEETYPPSDVVDAPVEEVPVPIVEEAPMAEPAAEVATAEPITVEPISDEAPMAAEIPEPVMETETTSPVAAEISETATFEDDSELFPSVPLTAYSEDAVPSAELEMEMVSADEPITGELDYGIVRKGDNLWNIAEKLRPNESVSIYQVMMALLRSNPDAFVDGNINRLKEGHVLRIEDAEMLAAISHEEAVIEYQSQSAAWDEYRQSVAATTSTQPLIGSEVEMGEEMPSETMGELTLASPDGSEIQSGEGSSAEAVSNDIVTLQDELRQVRQDASTMRGRNEELNEKLREMEDELTRLQRSISIKDDDLAALTKQLDDLRQQAGSEEVTSPAEVMMETPVTEPPVEALPVEEMPAVEEAPVEELVLDTPEPAVADEEVAAVDESVSPVELADEIARSEAESQPAKPDTAVVPPTPVPVGDEGIMAVIMDMLGGVGDSLGGIFGGDSLMFVIGVPAVLLVIILLLIVLRRRKASSDAYQESILTGGPSSVTGREAAESDEESSFLSDFAVSGAGAIQTEDSEVDPLTEADVFMAYGRYEAAEDRLKEAIEAEPARAELKVKLLELYNTTKNKPAFENTAETFYASIGDNAAEDPNWQKVVAMGTELVPNNPLFVGSDPTVIKPKTQEIPAAMTDSQVMDIGLDTGVFDAIDTGAVEPEPAVESDAGMDFNLDFGAEEPAQAGAENVADESASDLDFNLDLTSSDESSAGDEFSAAVTEEPSDAGLDFNLDLNSAPASDEAAVDESGALDFSLDMPETPAVTAAPDDSTMAMDFDLDLGAAGETAAEPAASDLSNDPTSDDLSMDFASAAEDSQSMDFELDASDAGAGDLDIGGGDEVGTKLDLAKAYIDMGDPDGARSILDEVMDEGSDAQKEEAQQLLQQIA